MTYGSDGRGKTTYDTASLTVESQPKPSLTEWLHWAEVVVDRLTACVHTYSRPPFDDVFMPEKDRLDKNGRALALLRRVYAAADGAETAKGSLAEIEAQDEAVITTLHGLFAELLPMLPELSADMQKLLKSHWHDGCATKDAATLFCGEEGRESEGIGNGYSESGRLPATLALLLAREEQGGTRAPRKSFTHPEHPDLHKQIHQRWASLNSRPMRRAGQVD